jgi:hypothetical protein
MSKSSNNRNRRISNERQSKTKPLAERLKAGLKEGIAYAKGKMVLRTAKLPKRPPKLPRRRT